MTDLRLGERIGPGASGARIVEARAGSLRVRLAETRAEIDASLDLRYQVFYEERAAKPTAEMAVRRQDFDHFDEICDHLLVIDEKAGPGRTGKVVGTYRLIRRAVAESHGGFYTADEYDITPILAQAGQVLELGRSCVAADYRNRATMQLLWRGIANYVFHHRIELLFGCASLPGTDPNEISEQLAYLYFHHLAPPELRPRAIESRYLDMRRLAPASIDVKRALSALPPLIKGYLRLGAFIGDGAVIDPQFNTIDICVVVKTFNVTERYMKHYTRDDPRLGESA
ncbi:MAG: GNAT family N-acetyltransferase [Alphaproteobacteria bacterium]